MISEIDMMSVNGPLADILGLSVKHFYRMECSIYKALDFSVGVTEEDFNKKVKALDEHCYKIYTEELALKKTKIIMETNTPETCDKYSSMLGTSNKATTFTNSASSGK